jgi:hypothetical protein
LNTVYAAAAAMMTSDGTGMSKVLTDSWLAAKASAKDR